MSAEKWVFLDIDQLVHQMFDKLIYRRWSLKPSEMWQPAVDIHETRDAYLIEIDLPDVPPEDVRFMVTERSLRIAGERRYRSTEGTQLGYAERQRGTFQRQIDFPQSINSQRVRLTCHHGTYRLHLPKKNLTPTQTLDVQEIEWEVRVTTPEGDIGNG